MTMTELLPLKVYPFILMCIGIPSCFSVIFTKGNNFCKFLFASLEDEALQRDPL